MTSENVHDDIQSRHTRHQPIMPNLESSCPAPTHHAQPRVVMIGPDRASLFLQCLGRVGAGGTEGLPEDGGEGDREG